MKCRDTVTCNVYMGFSIEKKLKYVLGFKMLFVNAVSLRKCRWRISMWHGREIFENAKISIGFISLWGLMGVLAVCLKIDYYSVFPKKFRYDVHLSVANLTSIIS